MSAWLDTLGVVAWPLIICSVIGLAVLLERLWFFVRTWRAPITVPALVGRFESDGAVSIDEYLQRRRHPWRQGFCLLIEHEQHLPALREKVVGLWVAEQRLLHMANLRWLTIVAVISPLLGLLGTVLGMIDAFAALVAHNGPVQPAILADGLQQAMFTTAVGLIIAVPALTAAHVFRLWGDARIGHLQVLLNHVHLAFEGAAPRSPKVNIADTMTTAERDAAAASS